MKKMLLVLRNEIVTLLTSPSFWLVALGLPLAGALVFAGVGAINGSASASQTISQVVNSPQDTRPEGYVDLSGLIRQIPPGMTGKFIAYPDETAARKALQAGKISAILHRLTRFHPGWQGHQYPPGFQPFSHQW